MVALAVSQTPANQAPANRTPAGRMLGPYALFGAAVAFAGPPIYIHTPSLYAAQHGLSLATVGFVLLAVRLLDFVQDPLLGWWIGRCPAWRRLFAAGFGALLGLGALALFAPAPLPLPALWLTVSLAVVFTGFSALQILYYSSGVVLAQSLPGGHNRLAGWREAGVLGGVCAACVAPALAASLVGKPYAFSLYAAAFCLLLVVAVWRMRRWWPAGQTSGPQRIPKQVLTDPKVQRLLLIGLINALPTGLTATLFVFFVEDRLQAAEHAGPALLLFFAAAAVGAPVWGRIANRIGARRALILGMSAATAAFLGAMTLGSGDWLLFYGICIASGFCVGADMTLLPALLSARLSNHEGGGELAFGLWGFVNKASLALAAGLALPALAAAGFEPGATANSPFALQALSIAYAGVPCVLKAMTVLALSLTPIPEGSQP